MHTKEPWSVVEVDNSSDMQVTPSHCIISGDTYIAAMESDSDENASRIVACVNACTGIPTEKLEEHKVSLCGKSYVELEQQRDDLLAALKAARRALASASANNSFYSGAYEDVDEAIKKAGLHN